MQIKCFYFLLLFHGSVPAAILPSELISTHIYLFVFAVRVCLCVCCGVVSEGGECGGLTRESISQPPCPISLT